VIQARPAIPQAFSLGMELCWLSAWAVYLTGMTASRPFPLCEAILAFVGAFLLARLSTGRGWLVLTVLGVQAAGLLSTGILFLRALSGSTAALADPAWLVGFLGAPRTPVRWLALGLQLAWLLGFWLDGVLWARRPVDSTAICARFDLGLGLFFGLFLIRWTADANGGVANDPLSPYFVLPFLISGLTAIGTIRLQGDGQIRFLPGSRGVGVFLTFAAAVLLAAAAALAFLLPVLTLAAEAGLVVLQGAGTLLGPALLFLLRLLFAPHTLRAAPAPPTGSRATLDPLFPPGAQGWWFDLVERILAWAMGIGMLLAGLVLLGLAAHALWRLLASRTTRTAGGRGGWDHGAAALAWLRGLLALLRAGLWGRRRAGEFYAALLGWARRGGLAHAPAETPAEFGSRLRQAFPRLAAEIDLLVEAFQGEAYGEMPLGGDRLGAAEAAWRTLRSPRHWPARARGLFRG